MAVFAHLLAFLESSKYVLIFIGSYVEGSTVMVTTGLLWRLGTLSFWPGYLALLLGDVLSDIMWYFVGYYAAGPFFNRYGHWFGLTPETIAKVKRRFHHYHTKILIISKLTMGFGFAVPVLAVAGMLKVPFSRFLLINASGSLVWVLGNMAIGYYFGTVVLSIPREFQIAAALLVLGAFFYLVSWLSKQLQKVDW